MAERLNNITIVVGKRGCGKTLRMINEDPKLGFTGLIHAYLKNRPDGIVIVLDTRHHPAYKAAGYKLIPYQYIRGMKRGIACVICNTMNVDRVFDELQRNGSNMMIVCEDSTKYLIKGKPLPEKCLELMVDTKQVNIDMIFLFHGFKFGHIDVWRLADNFMIFKTKDSPASREDEIENFEEAMDVYNSVKKNPSRYYCESIIGEE